jgi:hypothetical protein
MPTDWQVRHFWFFVIVPGFEKNTVSILVIKPVLLKDMRSSMTDRTKLIALSRPDDMSALDALKLLRFRRYNTARSQLRTTRVWSSWCAKNGLTPFPVAAVDVERYINGLNGSVKMATISHFIACLASVNGSLGFPDFRNVLIKALVQVWRARENEKKWLPARRFLLWLQTSIYSVGPSRRATTSGISVTWL